MKKLLLLSLSCAALLSHELIEIGKYDDTLEAKYKQDIIIINTDAFLAPSECLSQRLYGGLSQGDVWLNEIKKEHIELDDKTFKNLSQKTIDEQKSKQNIKNTIELKVAKEFITYGNGHLYGGLTQGKLDLSAQKVIKETPKDEVLQVVDEPKYNCTMLPTFDGYRLNIDSFKLLKDGKIVEIKDGVVRF
ncbi:MAG: hypothetical protein WC144_05550 [Sulfurimonas sp.]|nr:hypothetical protein [Sulfurimonadaceae bacterium]